MNTYNIVTKQSICRVIYCHEMVHVSLGMLSLHYKNKN
jgi:hypothetical protein